MKHLFERMRNWKYFPVLLVLLLCLAMLLIVGGNAFGSETKSDLESRLESIIKSVDGVGDFSVFVSETGGNAIGAIVICEGANDIGVRIDILNVVSTALNIPQSSIQICEMK